MTEDFTKSKLLLEQLKMASELHRHMDQMAWQSLSYFAALNGALLSAFFVVWSSRSLSIRGKEAFGFCIAVFAASASLVWSKVHKRMDLYHCLRSRQANAKEQALVESASLRANSAEDQYVLIYDGDPVEKHDDVMKAVPRSRWGKTSNYALVFQLALGLMSMWTLFSVLILAAFIVRSWADPALSTLFDSPVQP